MKFIVFEGLDGSGKSSLMRALELRLKALNRPVFLTREPGGTPLGDQLRQLILQKNETEELNPAPRAELLLYEASRAQHVERVIRPHLQKNYWILCDRFTASSIAFQAGGRLILQSQVEWLNKFATDDLKPDLTVLLDLSVTESKKRRVFRAASSLEAEDRIESEAEAFHERVRNSFLQQAQADQQNWLVLDAAQTPDDLIETLWLEFVKRNWVQ